jgi:ATP-dependent RNA helicase SUPV3L1/SUV3
MAPEALRYIEGLIKKFSDQYSIVRHERLAPLRYGGTCRGYQDLRPDDALICFSRKSVLSTAALLEKNGFRASVIYGALPPEARRNEVRKYTSGETNIVVATDAIGLGISLPIKRVIFAETEKYD